MPSVEVGIVSPDAEDAEVDDCGKSYSEVAAMKVGSVGLPAVFRSSGLRVAIILYCNMSLLAGSCPATECNNSSVFYQSISRSPRPSHFPNYSYVFHKRAYRVRPCLARSLSPGGFLLRSLDCIIVV